MSGWATDAQLYIPAAPALEAAAVSKRVAVRVPEAQFQHDVVSWARWWGWLVYFTHDSRGSPPGYPDLTLTRAGRLIFAELKSGAGTLSQDQRRWRTALQAVPGAEYFLWRPADFTLHPLRNSSSFCPCFAHTPPLRARTGARWSSLVAVRRSATFPRSPHAARAHRRRPPA